MKVELSNRFKNKLRGTFEKYDFEVGILEDKPHMLPKRGKRGSKGQDVLTTFAGIQVRQATRKKSGKMISDVSKAMRERFNYLQGPFQQRTSEINKLIKDFFNFAFGRSTEKRLENTLQAVVRNPMLRKDYGDNSALTQAIKGFSHSTIDTAQLFKNIKARVKRRV